MATTRKVSSTSITILVLTGISIGIAVHFFGLRRNPYAYQLAWAWKANLGKLKRHLRLSSNWPKRYPQIEERSPRFLHFVLVLLLFFQDISNDHVGQSVLILMTAEILPFISFFLIESLKDGRHWSINIPILMTIALLGQVVMIGAALPILLLPLYALSRWSEVKTNPAIVHPLPSPASWKVYASLFCGGISTATIFWTAFESTSSQHWIAINLIFQVFPLAWIPLFLIPVNRQRDLAVASSQYGSAASRQIPRLQAAKAYQLISFVCIPMWYFGVFWGGKPLFDEIRNGLKFKYPGVYLLFIDSLGVAAAMYLLVMIDSYIDEAKVQALGQGKAASSVGKNRVHAPRLFFQDVFFGSSGLLLFGPGWAMARYFQRREILAEQARFAEKIE